MGDAPRQQGPLPLRLAPAGPPVPEPPGMTEAAGATTIDGRMARQAAAAMLIGATAGRLTPSQILGARGGPPLLGAALDGAWGLGQQAALQAITEGRAPRRRQLTDGAMAIAAAAANQQVASLISGATRYGEDNGIAFLRNLEVEAAWGPGRRPSLSAETIDALFQSAALDHTLFLEAALRTDFSETTLNAGLGYRYQAPGSGWILGLNAFYDRAVPAGHQRMSLGLEAATSQFTLFANHYQALSGWADAKPGYQERPLSGWDAGIAGELPWLEDLHLSLAAFHWERRTEKDKTGIRLMADYGIGAGLDIGGSFAADDAGGVEAGLRLTYQFGAQAFGGDGPEAAGRDRRLAFVNRENLIRTEEREVPRDYAVAFLAGSVTAVNQSSLAFDLTGAPLRGRYSYRISSSGGGTPVAGTGMVSGDPQQVGGIDVSGLADGTLTLLLAVASKQGARGPEVSARISKATTALSATTATAVADPTNRSPIAFRISFSQAVNGLDAAALAVGNGVAANLRSDDNIAWSLDVTPTAQGEVTLQVPAGAATAAASGIANTASNLTSLRFDSLAPTGYGVSFLTGPITASGFEVNGGEPGARYDFTILSSGGGAPVSGSGTILAARQQVTGLDLSGLADGTLTLTLTLADAPGNAGSPATASMLKSGDPPVILSVTAPPSGDYDDL